MIQRLLGLGLIIVPFVSIYGQDIRKLKLQLAVGLALTLSLAVLNKQGISIVKNKMALVFVGYIWLATMLAPQPGVMMAGTSLGYFWVWKSYFLVLVFFFFMASIASIKFSEEDIRRILSIMVWAGFVMALFTLIQGLHLDQFFKYNIRSMGHPQWRLSGTLGHPSFVGTFLAMTVPLAIYLRRKGMAWTISITVLLIQSWVAIGSLFVALAFLMATKGKRYLLLSIVTLIMVSVGLTAAYFHIDGAKEHISSSGRYTQWPQIVKDINSPICDKEEVRYPLTGRGFGCFYYIYHLDHKNHFYQAHNEYLETTYNLGIIGLMLFLAAIGLMFYINFKRLTFYRVSLLSSFICIATAAGALFVWQLGAHILYTCVICGLLHNDNEAEYA